MPNLVPCPSCSRHVRVTDATCPFCTAALNTAHLRRRHSARFQVLQQLPTGLSRAALYAVGTALLTQTACDTQSQPAPTVDSVAATVAAATSSIETALSSTTAQPGETVPSIETAATAGTTTSDVAGSTPLTTSTPSATTAPTPLVKKPREYPRNKYNSVPVYGGPPRPRPDTSKK